MSRRRPRIIGTPGRRSFELATGGRPAQRLAEAVAPLAQPLTVQHLAVRHDDGCPCLAGKSMLSCTCQLVGVEIGGAL